MIPAWTQSYIGIPFVPRGRDWSGADCWGLARLVWQEQFGISVPAFLEYDNPNDPEEIGSYLAESKQAHDCWLPVESGQEILGDGVLIRCLRAEMHVGMVLDKGLMLHTRTGTDSCLEEYTAPRWKTRVLGFYRHKDLAK